VTSTRCWQSADGQTDCGEAPAFHVSHDMAKCSLSCHSSLLARHWFLFVALTLVFSATACHHRHQGTQPVAHGTPPPNPTVSPAPTRTTTPPTRTNPTPAPIIQGEEGIASWYGHPYHGRATANGEIYNMYAISAAHRTLPFGTIVRVHDLQNGKDVTVRINDRGPFVEGRIIDLSYAAAQAMGISGIAPVQLEILGYDTTPLPGIFAVQIGAFRDRSNAERLKARIDASYGPVAIQGFDRGDGYFYRVRVGQEGTEAAAHALAHKLRAVDLATESFVVRMN
jgi:rare lipoprotein A